MPTVIKRELHKDGSGFTDHPASLDEAEAIYGEKLDGRKSYAIIDGDVCETAEWTVLCSGCQYEDGSCGGCKECGYTGKRRMSQWVPMTN